jgi:catalase-peroxidase
VLSFTALEPAADGFRNYFSKDSQGSPATALVDRANRLTLTVPEMTVLVGGLRVLDANSGQARQGVLTSKPGTLSNDFFVNLLDMSTQWGKSNTEGMYEGRDRKSQAMKWTATPVDLLFGSNSELRAIAEVYASSDGQQRFLADFSKAWTKVMNLDRPDVK